MTKARAGSGKAAMSMLDAALSEYLKKTAPEAAIMHKDLVYAREKIACKITQLPIYNTRKGTHHAVKTAAVRHKE